MRPLFLRRVVLQPILRRADAQVEMLPLQLGKGRALPLLEFLHRIEMRHLDQRGHELEIGRVQ